MSKSPIKIPEGKNLDIYRDLSRTDPVATKEFKKSGFKGTQIDPAWRCMRLTEYFGPCGDGWGGEQVAYIIQDGIAFVCMRLWYKHPNTGEKCWTPEQWGGAEFVKKYSDGTPYLNDEALKMAATDALGKCAAMYLGLSADIYLGSFSDSKYRDEVTTYYENKHSPENKPAAIEKFENDIKARLEKVADLEGLDELWKSGVGARLREIGLVDKPAQSRIIKSFSDKKSDIIKLEESSGKGKAA